MKLVILVVGLSLTILGTILMIYQDVTITTHAQKVLDVGPLQATTEQTRSTIPISPVVGGVLLLAGVAAVFLGAYSPLGKGAKEPREQARGRASQVVS